MFFWRVITGVPPESGAKSTHQRAFHEKCVAHLLRNVSEVLEDKRGRARQFGETLKSLLREGLAVWHARRNYLSACQEITMPVLSMGPFRRKSVLPFSGCLSVRGGTDFSLCGLARLFPDRP